MERDYRIVFARAAAYIVDFILLFIILFFFNYFIPLPLFVSEIIEFIISFGYFVYFHWRTGQTYGKKTMGIKLINADNSIDIPITSSFSRELIWMIASLIDSINLFYEEVGLNFFGGISLVATLFVFVSIILNKENRGIHDKIAKTKVVYLSSLPD